MKAYAFLGVMITVLVLTAVVIWKSRTVSAKQQVLSCVSSVQEQCPSEYFILSYRRWVTMRDQLSLSEGKETVMDRDRISDEFNGLTTRLQGLVPKGMTWDDKKERFVSMPTSIPTAPLPVPPPVPVPVPAKK